MLRVPLLVSGGNRRRTQDTWLSAVHFLSRWTKAYNSRGTLKSKNADVAKRSANPRDFGSGFQAEVLCAQRKAWLQPTCACSLVPSHSQDVSSTACFVFLCAFPGGVLSAHNFSMPETCGKILSFLGESQLKCHSSTSTL